MDLSLDENEEALGQSVRAFVASEAPLPTLVKLYRSGDEYSPSWTNRMADAGWLSMLVAEALGGAEATLLQTAVVWEELGRAPLPGPHFASSVVAALILGAADSGARRDAVLAGIAAGRETVVPLFDDPVNDWTGLHGGHSCSNLEGIQLSGVFPYAPYAQAATRYLVRLQTDGNLARFGLLSADDDGVRVRELRGFLGHDREVAFTSVPIEEVVVVPFDRLDDALGRAYVLLAAQTVGGCQALLEMCVSYSNTRKQFGSYIGKFQRVQDHIVELVNALDAARWSMYESIWRFDAAKEGALASAHAAKALASEGYIICADAAHKVHGGIGMDPDYGMTLYTQRSRTLYSYLGGPRWHKRQMVRRLAWSS
jgi:alkylation response protein AidB-like acyl-CoA dehydrogenase